MNTKTLDGSRFNELLFAGAAVLEANRETVNNLNVFPVPDGDTGTNMSMTISGLSAMGTQNSSSSIADVSALAARNMMRAARGNSGVILSLFFRGVAKALNNHETADPLLMLNAFHEGAKSAAAAVDKPVEGTILTVMRECSAEIEPQEIDFEELFEQLYWNAEKILEKTPDMLPALRRAHVVDSGGYGFVRILEGMKAAINDEPLPEMKKTEDSIRPAANFDEFSNEDIRFAFCTECLMDLSIPLTDNKIAALKSELVEMGDSMVFTTDDEILKLHIHTNEPMTVLQLLYPLGTVRTVKIENMKHQHTGMATMSAKEGKEKKERKKYGIFTVSPGDGFTDLFKELGADIVISGGQSMNPSANDILKAIEQCPCETAIVLPNNKNIILTAKQVAEMCEDSKVLVIPTKTLPQGVSALFAYNESRSAEENREEMTDALKNVSSYSVTQAVRDAEVDGLSVRKHQYLGLCEDKVQMADDDLNSLILHLVNRIPDCEVMTVYYGKGVKKSAAEDMLEEIVSAIGDRVDDISLVYGGQPLYPYIISAE